MSVQFWFRAPVSRPRVESRVLEFLNSWKLWFLEFLSSWILEILEFLKFLNSWILEILEFLKKQIALRPFYIQTANTNAAGLDPSFTLVPGAMWLLFLFLLLLLPRLLFFLVFWHACLTFSYYTLNYLPTGHALDVIFPLNLFFFIRSNLRQLLLPPVVIATAGRGGRFFCCFFV